MKKYITIDYDEYLDLMHEEEYKTRQRFHQFYEMRDRINKALEELEKPIIFEYDENLYKYETLQKLFNGIDKKHNEIIKILKGEENES